MSVILVIAVIITILVGGFILYLNAHPICEWTEDHECDCFHTNCGHEVSSHALGKIHDEKCPHCKATIIISATSEGY